MPTSSIRLLADSSGARVATRSRSEDSLTKEILRYQTEYNKRFTGLYFANFIAHVVATAAQVSPACLDYFINPLGSANEAALISMDWRNYRTATNIRVESPRILFERFTFTGSTTDTALQVGKKRSIQANPSAIAVSLGADRGSGGTPGGISVTNVAAFGGFFPVIQMTTASSPPTAFGGSTRNYEWAAHDSWPVFSAAEGFLVRQADAGAATEGGRVFIGSLHWAEFTEI